MLYFSYKETLKNYGDDKLVFILLPVGFPINIEVNEGHNNLTRKLLKCSIFFLIDLFKRAISKKKCSKNENHLKYKMN